MINIDAIPTLKYLGIKAGENNKEKSERKGYLAAKQN